jgi:ABC-2 type transport system permease protein
MMVGLFKNEVKKLYSHWRSFMGYILFLVLIPIIMWAYGKGADGIPSAFPENYSDLFLFTGKLNNGLTAAYFVLNFFWVHIPFLIALVGGDIFAGEEAQGTYRIYLTRAVPRWKIFVSKVLASFFYTFTIVVLFIIMTLGLGLIWHGSGDMVVFHEGMLILPQSEALYRFFLAYIFAFSNMLLVNIIALFFSTMVKNSIGPMVGTMAVIIFFLALTSLPLDVFDSIRPYLFTHYFDNWKIMFYDPIPWGKVVQSMLVISGHSIILLFAAFYIFNRKDIVS